MLVVRVELWSAIDGSRTEIARSVIYNDGTGTPDSGNYVAATLRGRDREELDKSMVSFLRHTERETRKLAVAPRFTRVSAYPRKNLHVWHLVSRALANMGFNGKRDQNNGDD